MNNHQLETQATRILVKFLQQKTNHDVPAHRGTDPTSFPGSLSPRPQEPLLSQRERPCERGLHRRSTRGGDSHI